MQSLQTVGVFAAVFAFALATGCNTVRGVGKDIEEGGEVIQETATEAQT